MEDYKYYNYFYYILFPIYKLKGISLIKKKISVYPPKLLVEFLHLLRVQKMFPE